MRGLCRQLFSRTFFVLGVTLMSFFGVATMAVAEDSITSIIEDKEDRIDEIKAKIKAYKQIIDLKQKQGAALSDQIESLEAQANKLQLEIDTNQKTLAELDADISVLTKRISEKEGTIRGQKEILSELVRTYFFDQARSPRVFLMFAEHEMNPFQADVWTGETGEKVQEVLSGLQALRVSLLAEQETLTTKRNQADSLRLQLEQRNVYLETTKDSKANLLAKAQNDAKRYDALVDDLEKEREAIEDEISSIESGKIDSLDMKDVPKFQKGLLSYPVKKVKITQKYGKTTFTRWYTFHNGVDFGVAIGTDILAAADGKVVAIGNNGRYAYGRYIAIDHGNGLVTMYGHLSATKKSIGTKVKRGEVIAKSGNTGYSTGPHLHFTVFSTKSFDVVPSSKVKSVKDIPVGATLNPTNYLP